MVRANQEDAATSVILTKEGSLSTTWRAWLLRRCTRGMHAVEDRPEGPQGGQPRSRAWVIAPTANPQLAPAPRPVHGDGRERQLAFGRQRLADEGVGAAFADRPPHGREFDDQPQDVAWMDLRSETAAVDAGKE